ncbi:DUF1990 domain-containing protein [Umezawaea endophytica]|uniref:DUF1990 domain-containing protein n=1 Tax=Umezawaea endophytica TaxID=1654476 RepID=A0A9X2ZZS2_9PSEU|nr:DUF1990 domain-containing protein [Umezawaea endophytica]MCS7477779.1 DUF1990 domain-containing protein [Umezawaea endophytica]
MEPTAELDALCGLPLNYDPRAAPVDGVAAGHWHVDSAVAVVGAEPPGPPLPDGAWARACLLVERYEFSDPSIMRAFYRRDDELLGRDMLLEGRFAGLRFYLGVRVTSVVDETRGTGEESERVWGWSYQTLRGHLEEGRLSYEVVKDLTSGAVSFRVSGYSRRAPLPNPVIRAGFQVFGRWTQKRFYGAVLRRLRDLVAAAERGEPPPPLTLLADGVVLAPSGARSSPWERVLPDSRHPGR